MKDPAERRYFSRYYPYYLAGIVIFFLVNGYSQYINRISMLEMLLFGILWVSIAFGSLYLCNRLFRSLHRAALFTAFLLIAYLFFGDIHGGLRDITSVFSRFRAICCLMIAGAIIVFILLQKSNSHFTKLTAYLNVLSVFIIVVDLVRIVGIVDRSGELLHLEEPVVNPGRAKNKPDFYLVILDEYAGNETLKRHFNFDNSAFLDSLRERSFFVAQSPLSNYTSTPVSVASIFQMNYIPWSHGKKTITVDDYSNAEITMKNSPLFSFFQTQGYKFHNYSIFNIGSATAKYQPDLLPTRLKLITKKCFHNQLKKHVLVSLEENEGDVYDWLAEYFQNSYRTGNNKLVNLTMRAADDSAARPKFVYLHLLMPHWPYLNDTTGKKVTYNAFRKVPDEIDRLHYLSYLRYTNLFVLSLVDDLKKRTGNKAVIVVMSDHGYRKIDARYPGSGNTSLNATFLPDKNYTGFYDTISNVNQFRIILNGVFLTQMPFLRDSIVY